MRIAIPHSAHPLTRVNVITPQGVISGDSTTDHKFFDVDLPEGVTEDDVSIVVEYLTNGQQVVDSVIVKTAIEKSAALPVDEIVTDEQIDAAITDDCNCEKPAEACSKCDPEDEIAEQP